ncbi:PAS domain S-box protein [Draconibacterium sp.]|uniref:PAS domain S-box protein n=1 Tax=Draconibacterium sp. TaxID=1965318 RepID=UPI0035650F62
MINFNQSKEQLILELQKLKDENKALKTKCKKLVSKQNKKIETLELKEIQRQLILKSSVNGFLRLNSRGCLLEVNDVFCQMTGYSRQELLKMHISDLSVLEDKEASVTHIQKIKEKGYDRFESVHRRKDGSVFDVEACIYYLDINGGQLIGFCTDITEKKQVLNSLLKMEQKYQEIMLNSPIGLALVSPSGNFLKVNSSLCKMTGYSETELLKLDFQSITHPDDLDTDLNFFNQLLNGEIPNYQMEKRYFCKDESLIWVQLNVSLVRRNDNSPKYLIAQIQNITQQKLTELALKETEKKYRLIADNMGNMVTITDLELNLTYVSPSVAHILGYTPAEYTEAGLSQIISPESMKEIAPIFREELKLAQTSQAELNRSRTIELQAYKKNGELVYLEVVSSFIRNRNQSPVGILSVSRDITERKNAELLQLETTRFYEQIIEKTHSGLMVCGMDSRYILWNPAMEKISGISAEEAIGKHPLELFPFLEEQGVWELFLKAKAGEIVSTPDYPYAVPKTGKSGWGKNEYFPLLNPSNNIIGVIGSARDITKTKNTELEIKARLQVEELFNDISFDFVRNSYLKTDKLIDIALRKLGIFTKVDRTYVFQFEKHGTIMSNTHEWCNKGIEPQIENLQNLPVELFPWWMNKMKNFEIIQYENIANLPEEAEAEQKILEEQDIISILVLPMIEEGKLRGFVGFDSVKCKKAWKEHDVKVLSAIADLISGELARTKRMKELVNAKQKAEENENKFRKLSTLTFEGIVIMNKTIALDINKSFTRLSGYTRKDFIGKDVIELAVPKKYHSVIYKNMKEEHAPPYEIEMFKKDGTVLPVEIESRFIVDDKNRYSGRVIAVRDIRWRKKVQAEISKLMLAVEQSANIIVITDVKGNIEYTNPKFTEVSGYTSEEVRGKHVKWLSSGNQSKDYFIDMWETISSGKVWKGLFHNKKKNGDFYWEQATIAPIKNDDKEIVGFMAIKEDITALRESERQLKIQNRELKKAKEKAEESDRLKSAFLANMSHEIRTPMNGILGFTGLLLEPDFTSEDKAGFIKTIHQSGQRLLNTVTDIVEISKIEAGIVPLHKKEINVNERIEELVRFFKLEAEQKGLQLLVDKLLPAKAEKMITDQSKLDSILTNLIKNALKFTDSGTITIGCRCNGTVINFYVKDTGIGIPINRQNAVFERFVQADIEDTRAFEGLGLGLAISKSYAELLGGKIWMESEEGIGSTFYLSLPIRKYSI